MLLASLTVFALTVAAVMSWMAWRVVRDDRDRSDARVAALATDLARDAGELELTHTTFASSGIEGAALRDVEGPALTGVEGPYDMFATTARPARRGMRWAAAAVIGALVFAVAIGTIVGFSLRAPSDAAQAPIGPSPAQPLELISLHHERTADRLIVKGFIRNPTAGTPATRISAVVFLFDRDGAFVTSGRALVDFLTLTPGEESPFVVQIPAAGSIGRYRVSFRNPDGSVMPHVDRRPTGTLPSMTSRSVS